MRSIKGLLALGVSLLVVLSSTTAMADMLTNDYVDIKLGGYMKLDTYFNTNKVVNLDAPLWVDKSQTELYDENGKTFGATVRASRFWFDISAKNLPEGYKLSAHLEMDFYGDYASSATGSRLPQVALRHYFATLDMGKVALVVGQTWMIAAPQFTASFDNLVQGTKGDLWNRMPQISLKTKFDVFEGGKMHFDIGALRPISARDAAGVLVDNGSVGEITGIPMFQARLALDWTMLGAVSSFGVSGSFHREKYADPGIKVASGGTSEALPFKGDDTVNAYFVALDAKLKMSLITLTLEGYYGQNLDSFWGNNAKWGAVFVPYTDGVDSYIEVSSVKEMGGFVNIGIAATDKLTINLGGSAAYTLDIGNYNKDTSASYNLPTLAGSDAKLVDPSKVGIPIQMQYDVYGNVTYNIFKGFYVGYELQYMATDWDGQDKTAKNLYNNLMFKYVF